MRGRRVLMESFVAHGVRHIFGNPGTTETPLLDSLPAFPQIDYIMALHEGVAVGAASFYAQAANRATVANVHVAPGLGNAIGAIYGALKANSPVVVTAGQQDTRMRLTGPVLGHDLVAMAAPVTKWSVQIERADEIAPILRRAFKVATDAPKGPVFVALPIDVLEQETAVEAILPDRLWRAAHPDPKGVEAIASLIAKSSSPTIVVGDDVARAQATDALVALRRDDRRIRVVRRLAGARLVSDRASQLPALAARRCRADPKDARSGRSRAAGGRAVLRGHLVCARRSFSDSRGGGADRGGARADRLQSPARRRPRRRDGGESHRAHEPVAFAGERRVQVRRAAPQRRAGRSVGAGGRRLQGAAGESLEQDADVHAAGGRGVAARRP